MINEYPYHKAPPILKTVYIYAYQARLNRYDYCTTFIVQTVPNKFRNYFDNLVLTK